MEKIEFEEVLDKDGEWVSRTRKKFASGMTAEFGFWFYADKGWGGTAYPYFTIYRKRNKQWPEDKRTATGRDGLEPAMWALKCLEEVERVPECSDFRRVTVGWSDERRKELYTRILSKRGYQMTVIEGEEVLTLLTTPQESS